MNPWLFPTLGLIVVVAPAVLTIAIGLPALLGFPLSERGVHRWTSFAIGTGLLAALGVLGLMLLTGDRNVEIELGNWVQIPEQHFHFHLKFVFDRLSTPMVMLTLLLCGVVGAFTGRYLHREAGYGRFYLLYAIFTLGMVATALAGTIETLFFGWELVGLSSALLIAYFHERQAPVRNGLRVWCAYRIADAAFLIAAVVMHHLTGAGDFEGLMGSGPWPAGKASLTSGQALLVGLLLMVAVMGKSGLIPFSGWLPRAMEGPTPSSAIFYGALSVHLGAYLLLRISPILEQSLALQAIVVIVGLATAVLATGMARVQTDVKSALAFASLTQVGLIVAEIGFGLRYLALIHIIGHACLRTLQLLRAPSLLREHDELADALGARPAPGPPLYERILPATWRTAIYHFLLERAWLDTAIDEWLIRPFQAVFRRCDGWERRWTDWLAGGPSRVSDELAPRPEIVDELRL